MKPFRKSMFYHIAALLVGLFIVIMSLERLITLYWYQDPGRYGSPGFLLFFITRFSLILLLFVIFVFTMKSSHEGKYQEIVNRLTGLFFINLFLLFLLILPEILLFMPLLSGGR